jgi:hypothetical protein
LINIIRKYSRSKSFILISMVCVVFAYRIHAYA